MIFMYVYVSFTFIFCMMAFILSSYVIEAHFYSPQCCYFWALFSCYIIRKVTLGRKAISIQYKKYHVFSTVCMHEPEVAHKILFHYFLQKRVGPKYIYWSILGFSEYSCPIVPMSQFSDVLISFMFYRVEKKIKSDIILSGIVQFQNIQNHACSVFNLLI